MNLVSRFLNNELYIFSIKEWTTFSNNFLPKPMPVYLSKIYNAEISVPFPEIEIGHFDSARYSYCLRAMYLSSVWNFIGSSHCGKCADLLNQISSLCGASNFSKYLTRSSDGVLKSNSP